MTKVKILIVDDQVQILNSLRRLLRTDYEVFTAESGPKGLEILDQEPIALILSDQRMPGMDGVTFLTKAKTLRPDAVRLMITGYADIDATIDAINRANIFQYISKPFEPDELRQVVASAAEHYRLQRKNEQLHQQLLEANRRLSSEKQALQQQVEKTLELNNFIANSPSMIRILKMVRKVMNTPTTVLLLGETGTGKELLARIIHYNSNRKEHMFVVQNCGAIPDTLLQSELFGHTKGAFTGAHQNKEGLFETAHEGTVFLDEIGETSPAFQLGLLRVLQEGEIKALGANTTRKVNVRIIAATNRNLEKAISEGRFREDLYYRLSVFPIHLPPLRKRKEDIPDLVDFFIRKYAKRIGKTVDGISTEALDYLLHYSFPGNIRELENEIERMVTLAENDTTLDRSLLSPHFFRATERQTAPLHQKRSLKKAVAHLEQQMIEQALANTGGNILKAADQLGISRVGLHKMLKRFGIDARTYKAG